MADHKRYLALAGQAKDKAYAPYSDFRVGACVVDAKGNAFIGCNVENASYGATMCAERNAVGAAVASGHRDITAIYIDADGMKPVVPCGICRQVLFEMNPDMRVITSRGGEDGMIEYRLSDLLPHAFSKSHLG